MAEAGYPEELRYHPEHAWVDLDGDVATVGITWFAQDALGEVVFFDPPALGASVLAGQSCAELESLKAVSDVIAPIGGEVVEVNAALEADAGIINEDPYGAGWLLKVRVNDRAETAALLDAAGYAATLG